MNESYRIDDVQIDFLQRTDVLRFKLMVMIGIEICNAAAARRNVVEPALIERFEKNQDRTRGTERRHVGQLIGLQYLAAGDDWPRLRAAPPRSIDHSGVTQPLQSFRKLNLRSGLPGSVVPLAGGDQEAVTIDDDNHPHGASPALP